ncbi:MAG TPA: hypothetical protein PKO47_12940, partial [bacterium]|nr:hypothetical protein [bacterium]
MVLSDKDKKAALDRTLTDIVKEYGKGSIMKLGERTAMQVEVFSTGSISID